MSSKSKYIFHSPLFLIFHLQIICIQDLKSTIVPIRSVALGLTKKYYTVSRQFKNQLPNTKHDIENPASINSPLSENDNFSPVHLVQLQNRFYSARNMWSRQADKLKHLFSQCQSMVSPSTLLNGRRTGGNQSPSRANPLTRSLKIASSNSPLAKEIFDAILLTIIGETKQDREIAIDNLLQIFDDYPVEMEFYIPQIAFFLLYGAFELEEQLKRKLLIMCEKNVSFAYKLYWFIHAFCLNRSDTRSRMEDNDTEESDPNDERDLKERLLRQHVKRSTSSNVSRSSTLFRMDSESFDVLDQFQENIHRVGEQACNNFIKKMQDIQPLTCTSSNASTSTASSYLTVDERSKLLPSKKVRSEKETQLIFPLYLTKPRISNNGSTKLNHRFEIQLNFWNALINMTREIFMIPKNQRQLHLIQILKQINEEYLPSNIIHIPLGNTHHRVWKIHVEECFSFATKERTPVLLCFEVLYYKAPQR